jgi:hypothetical protein
LGESELENGLTEMTKGRVVFCAPDFQPDAKSPCALYLRSVCVAIIALGGLRCHLLTRMLLNSSFCVDSTRLASTIYFQ